MPAGCAATRAAGANSRYFIRPAAVSARVMTPLTSMRDAALPLRL